MTRVADPLATFLFRRISDEGTEWLAPAADLSQGTLRPEELNLYLTEVLGRAHPGTLARFAMPADTTLLELDVELPWPRRWKPSDPTVLVSLPCIVMPHGRVRWVIVVPLELVVHVPPKGDLETLVAEAVRRQVRSAEMQGTLWKALLPGRSHSLEQATIGRVQPDKNTADRLANERAWRVLETIGHKLRARPVAPLVARDDLSEQLSNLLGDDTRRCVVLVGDALVGKSALFRAWLRKNPERLVVITSGARLLAGMCGFGQWQAQLTAVMEAAEQLDAILYLEQLSELFGDRPGGSVDLPGAMRPFLNHARVRIVGELSPKQIKTLATRDAGFFAAFTRLRLEPLSFAHTQVALERRVSFDKLAGKRAPLRPEALGPLLRLAERYLPYDANPGKVIGAYEQLTDAQDAPRLPDGSPAPIDARAVFDDFARRTGMPLFLLREDRALRFETMLDHFAKHLVGQEDAVNAVAETLCTVKARLQPGQKPLASFLFVGPTGVGKTELARTLAGFLFGSTDNMVRFDMSEFADPYAAERLIRGLDGRGGLLTSAVRRRPFCVILLDELEKADDAVFDLLLQVCGEGRLTDGRGQTTYFHNTLIVMTSNIGARRGRSIGLVAAPTDDASHYLEAVDRRFRPEFVNRLDRIVPFRSLTPGEAREVVEIALRRVFTRRGFAQRNIELTVTEAAREHLAKTGYSSTYNGRALRRHLEDALVTPAARALTNVSSIGGKLAVDVIDGQISMAFIPATRQERGGNEWIIGSLRRQIQADLESEPIEALKASLAALRSRLAHADRIGDLNASNIGQIQHRYEHEQAVWQRLDTMRQEVETAEDLALLSIASSEDIQPFIDETKAISKIFDRAYVEAALSSIPGRDSIILLVQGEMTTWLQGVKTFGEELKWHIRAHVFKDKTPSNIEWPNQRQFGPPKTLPMLTEDEKYKPILLVINGSYAGALMGLEHGHIKTIKDNFVVRHLWIEGKIPDALWEAEELQPFRGPEWSKALKESEVREAGPNKRLKVRPQGKGYGTSLSDFTQYWPNYFRVAAADIRFWLKNNSLSGRYTPQWAPEEETP